MTSPATFVPIQIDVRQIGPANPFELKSNSSRDAILHVLTQIELGGTTTVYISTRKTQTLPLAILTKENPTLVLNLPLLKDDEVSITASDKVCLVVHATASADDIQVDASMEVPPRLLPAVLKIKLGDVSRDAQVRRDRRPSRRRHDNVKVGEVDPEITSALIGCAMGGAVKAAVPDKTRDSFKFFLKEGEDLLMVLKPLRFHFQ
ncbi:hypothetical protein CF328_g6034 [Tilletia controversa]|nr:hypothetical protein CF328_g6034 [Tilletia controversa]